MRTRNALLNAPLAGRRGQTPSCCRRLVQRLRALSLVCSSPDSVASKCACARPHPPQQRLLLRRVDQNRYSASRHRASTRAALVSNLVRVTVCLWGRRGGSLQAAESEVVITSAGRLP